MLPSIYRYPLRRVPNQNSSESPPKFLENVKDLVEIVGKIVIGLFAIFYALGVIVVNIHLNKYGVYSLSLFRLNYVAAGVWAFIPFALVFTVSVLIFFVLSLMIPGFRIRLFNYLNIRDVFAKASNTSGFPITLVLSLLLLLLISYTSFKALPQAWNDIWFSLISGFTATAYIVLLGYYTLRSSSSLHPIVVGSISALIFIIVFGFYIGVFAGGLYGKIPSYLGGGSPKQAQLILDEDSKIKEKLEAIGVVFRPSTFTVNVQILLDTDTDYILIIETNDSNGKPAFKGLTLPKDVVKAVLYNKIEEGFSSGGGSGI